ncbi:MAG TPA: hypothetical protein VJU14_10585 [Solirubrobacterales bacterium]|nr:hypothetical protein [Solirubrobacterales bacterium]
MPSFKKFGLFAAAVFALSAIGAANASAAQFTASATGTLSGKATATQVFTTNGGQVKCTTAASSGEIKSTASAEQTVEVKYSGCTAFGFVNTHITPAQYNFTASGQAHVENTITITPTGAGCSITIHPQTDTITKFTSIFPVVIYHTQKHLIAYTSSGGLCGSSGNNGTFTGTGEWSRVGGGSLSYDP